MKPTILFSLILLMAQFTHAKPPADTQARLDSWITGQPGGISVAWVDADGVAFFQSGKIADGNPHPITPETQYEVGSVTKIFTALLLAESERLGKVSRHDSAAKYLLPSDDPAQTALAKITLLSLTTHTSGLPRLPGNIGANPDTNPNPYAAYDRPALIAALRTHGPNSVVGGPVSYSNFGVSVLGEALAAAWSRSYNDALRKHVLDPLAMSTTTVGLAGAAAPSNLAPGHADGKRVPNWTFLACAGCGAVRSSARDMAKFLGACLHGNEAPLHEAITATIQPQFSVPELGEQIGLGWMIIGEKENPVYWHNGATAGSHAFVAFSPKLGAGVVLMANSQKSSDSLGFALLGIEPPQPKTAVANAADFPGRYPLTPAFAIDITALNGSLFAQATGQTQLAMRPSGNDRFAIIGVPAEISFERDAAGKITGLVLHQNGRDMPATRSDH